MLKVVAPGSLFVRSMVAEGGSSAEPLDVRCGKRPGGFAPSSSRRGQRAGGMKGTGAMRPSSMFYVHEADVVQIHHFLDECSLCDKPLSGDIFMYRGDTPFCSEECRQQQIEVDRAKHRRKKRAALAARREHQHRLRHHHQQPRQPRPPGMDKRRVDACYARAPALRV